RPTGRPTGRRSPARPRERPPSARRSCAAPPLPRSRPGGSPCRRPPCSASGSCPPAPPAARRLRRHRCPGPGGGPRATARCLGALVHLDPRDRAGLFDKPDQRGAVGGVLVQRLLVEDHAGDVAFHRLGAAEQEFAIVAAVLFAAFHPDAVETLLDGARTLVGR